MIGGKFDGLLNSIEVVRAKTNRNIEEFKKFIQILTVESEQIYEFIIVF